MTSGEMVVRAGQKTEDFPHFKLKLFEKNLFFKANIISYLNVSVSKVF